MPNPVHPFGLNQASFFVFWIKPKFDDNGNTLTESDGITTTASTYDSRNRLVGSDAGGAVISMGYDPEGLRVDKSVDGETTEYLVDTNRAYGQVVFERAGTAEIEYTFGTDILGFNAGGEQYVYHWDALGSTRTLTNGAAMVVDSLAYDVWGEQIGSASVAVNNYLFTGEQFDPDLGDYYLRARYYNTGNARFTRFDEWEGDVANTISLNKYAYGNADPANGTDPSGNATLMSLEIGLSSGLRSTSFRVVSLLNAFDRIQNTVSFVYDMSSAVRSIFGQSSSYTAAGAKLTGAGLPPRSDVNLRDAVFSASYNLPRAIGTGIGDWSRGLASSRNGAKKISAFLINLPLVSVANGAVVRLPTPAKVRVGNRRVPVKLQLGAGAGASGQLVGVGVKVGALNRQLIRMDYHEWHSNRQGRGDLAFWKDGDFHYHVRKWNQ